MKTLNLSTNLIGLDGVFCTYWGSGKSEYVLNEDNLDSDFEEGYGVPSDYYFGNFNDSKYMEDWNKCVLSYVEDVVLESLRDIGQNVVFTARGYWSPREYNFSHDVSNFDIEAEDFNKLVKYCENHKNFPKYLKENFSSYDGFTSFTANNLSEWKEDIESDSTTAYGAAISFIINEVYQGNIKNESYSVFDDMYISEYIKYTEYDKFVEEVKSGYVDLEDVACEWKVKVLARYLKDLPLVKNLILDGYRSGESAESVADTLGKNLPTVNQHWLEFVTGQFNEFNKATGELF
jgi:hypothetical protein